MRTATDDQAWLITLVEVLKRCEMAQPDEIISEINSVTGIVGIEMTVYLADLEQVRLRPLPERGKPSPAPLTIDGTIAGRAFTQIKTVPAGDRAGPLRLWVPIVDDSERLGVADVLVLVPPASLTEFEVHQQRVETLIGLIAHLLATKRPYGDTLHQVRRTREMSVSGELLLAALPPLTFSCHRMVVSAILEPCYEVGGDAFDYAVDGPLADLVVLDATGHGLRAGLTATLALAAIRAARRNGEGLYAMARAVDTVLVEQFGDFRFATGVLAELDLDTGLMRYINAGHPEPLLMRRGKAIRALDGGRRLPMGLDDSAITVAEEMLEPGDRLLLYTDGVVEARSRDGQPFGLERLVDLAERSAVAQLPAPETLRRLSHKVLAHQDGPPRDDATILLMEWSRAAAERTYP
jgi:sigma-B regulation protein RsbU (phosphoserine phosphatase)